MAKPWPSMAVNAGTRDVQEVGRIQVMGDTHLLGLMYEESL